MAQVQFTVRTPEKPLQEYGLFQRAITINNRILMNISAWKH